MTAFSTALITGRFQTFHNGHSGNIYKAMALAYNTVIVIGSAQESGTERNPFSAELRKLILEDAFSIHVSGSDQKIWIITLEDMTNESDHCVEWGDYLMNSIRVKLYAMNKLVTPDVMIFGNDGPENSPMQWFDEKWQDKLSFVQIARPAQAVSATKLREAMLLGKEAEWKKGVPIPTHKYYGILREQLLKIPFYQEKLEKLKESVS
jgi:bifunctional NMN adenylyltransferase/nudix hydrolase